MKRYARAPGIAGVLLVVVVGGSCSADSAGLTDTVQLGSRPDTVTADAGVDRLYAQLPDLLSFDEVTGAAAVRYYEEAASELPAAAEVFRELASSAACASRLGTVATKAYLGAQPTESVGVLVVSDDSAAGDAARVLTTCFLTHSPPSGFRRDVRRPLAGPCLTKYYYDASTSGSADRYFLLVAGADPSACDRVLDQHARFDPQPFDVA